MTLDKLKTEVATDPMYDIPLEPLQGLPSVSPLKQTFPTGGFKENDFNRVVLSRRNKSSPGLNMIPYTVYKKCGIIR